MAKTIEQNFADWESNVFGFGYGSGEGHTLRALRTFFEFCGRDPERPRSYDYRELEVALGATVAWLLINILCHYGVDVIEYGTSPRFGWLTAEGEALKDFMLSRPIEGLIELCTSRTMKDSPCYPDGCNCGPNGYREGFKCPNPFWAGHH